jgi:uncharacterized protein DUF3854
VNPHLELLLSPVYDGALAPVHRADLEKSGLTGATIAAQAIRSVPPALFSPLLGFDPNGIRSALLVPYPDPAGGWFDHVRVKVFPSFETSRGTIKYLQPRRSGVRVFFPVGSKAALRAAGTLLVVEGEKKALACVQLGLPAVGIAGIEGWHRAGSTSLLPDFAAVTLRDRMIELVPDGDVETNPNVARGAARLAEALEASGARVRLVRLPMRQAA